MLERETHWRNFLGLINNVVVSPAAIEDISIKTRVGKETVAQYLDQLHGLDVLKLWGTLPPGLKEHAVAFRYRHLTRWVTTAEIMIARREYDAGRNIVTQGLFKVRDLDAWVLFSIPRKTPGKLKMGPWFSAKREKS